VVCDAAAVIRSAGTADRAFLQRLGLRVKVLRTARRMSQEELAEAAGLDRTYVSRIERGAHNITVLTLVRVADVLEVSAGRLLDSAWDVDPIGAPPEEQAQRFIRTGRGAPDASAPGGTAAG
jgi:transcriptional regulator with XRE-family HTH domain